ncbi:interleukin 17 receptor A1a [Trichomycterus rosablanca]|uniref:interleukin 17 receptor A1a n=1 Tax=Trichomycterus rosablanca TaxID=2290929 RepID=UPI002F3553DB
MALLCLTAALFSLCITRASALHIANSSSLNCTQKDLSCKATINNCIYKGWLKPNQFTPSGPVDLKVHVDVKMDKNGDWVPVIMAQWKARDDGSISFLNGTELQVMEVASGGHLCVHYIFLQKFQSMINANGELWSFSLDKVVVEPEMEYLVSVANLPKPNIDQTGYNLSKTVTVPRCTHPSMQQTRICIERGEFWQPNITMVKSGPDNRTLDVTFKTEENSGTYNVIVRCNNRRKAVDINKNNSSSLNVTFDLDAWPPTCCNFVAQIQPFFMKCGNDCLRKERTFNICNPDKHPPPTDKTWTIFVVLFIVLCGLCLILAVGLCCRKCRKEIKPTPLPPPPTPITTKQPVLIIYSRDHPKYTEIVLKLCAFLRAKCGTEVYLDLLDTASIGAMGRLPWIEFQMRRIEQSSGKVMVLCSQGMQAKWGAICGGPRVHLREDVCSTMGDMLTPALQLITPDMQRPASHGKYLVAYFEDVSAEYDVPSMFDVAVKYKLMKHFEELFFRVLDQEKYQQGRVHTIEGIGIDEYFNCPSGKALRDAIETFQAYQLENPDWFEKECLESEDAVVESEVTPLFDQCTPSILQCDPVLNGGPSVYECEVEMHDMDQAQSVRTTEIPYLNSELEQLFEEPSVLGIHPAHNQVYSLCPDIEPPSGIYTVGAQPPGIESQPWLMAEPALQESLSPSRNGLHMNSRSPADGCSADDVEEGLVQLQNLQVSLASFAMAVPPPSLDDYNYLSWDTQPSQPVEIDESEVEEDVSGKRPSRWSDQGYSSRDSREEPPPSSLAALAKLQEVLFINSPISSGFGTETIES